MNVDDALSKLVEHAAEVDLDQLRVLVFAHVVHTRGTQIGFTDWGFVDESICCLFA